MVFSSIQFLWIFLPIVLILYWLIGDRFGNKVGNVILLIASLIFYAWGEPVYILLMLLSVTVNYVGALLIAKADHHSDTPDYPVSDSPSDWAKVKHTGKAKLAVILTIVVNLLLLGYFKYFGLFTEIVNAIAGGEAIPVKEIALPLGISFYTFQAMSYVIDVYRRSTNAQKNYAKVLLYISLFPQLIAGPIVKYRDVAEQIDHRTPSLEKKTYGIKRFVLGLSKKVLFANTFGSYADALFGMTDVTLSTGLQWLKMIYYALQIYYDFSGYSDMAIGLGAMFGFDFKENFNYPFISRSVKEYWGRWHISLSTWFREYVYIPLGGSRKGTGRTYLNIIIIWGLTGLWHGASLNMVAWGLYFGVFLILERLFFGKILDFLKAKHLGIIGLVYRWIVCLTAWAFFREENMAATFESLKGMFTYTPGQIGIIDSVNGISIATVAAGVLLSGFIQKWFPRLRERLYDREKISIPGFVLLMVLVFVCVIKLITSSYNAFIYFRF